MKKVLLLICCLQFSLAYGQDYISNLDFKQEENTVQINYDLAALEHENQYYKIFVRVESEIQGKLENAFTFVGDIGRVKKGGSKQIIWNVIKDYPVLRGSIEIQLKAELYKPTPVPTPVPVPVPEKCSSFKDSRDGRVYQTVRIGNQCWMAENLDYKIPGSYNSKYGRFYTWNAAKEACPKGWHLPSNAEWERLEISLGMNKGEANLEGIYRGPHGIAMKSKAGWHKNNGTNNSGFNAFPAGNYAGNGKTENLSGFALFWSATESSGKAWCYGLFFEKKGVARSPRNKGTGFSCRCVKS